MNKVSWLTLVATALCLAVDGWSLAQSQNRAGSAGTRESDQDQSAATELWLEALETYTIPFDPFWFEAVADRDSASSFHAYFPSFSAEIDRKVEESQRRASRAKNGEEAEKIRLKAADAAARQRSALFEKLAQTADKPMPLTVVRAWDGIKQEEVVVVFGRGQRALADRLRPGKVLRGTLARAAPGEDYQAPRVTLREVQAIASTPTDFARAVDAPSAVLDLAFGELDASRLSAPVVIRADKDATPGSGVLEFKLRLRDSGLAIDLRFPCYAEFRLFELDKNGARAQEVRFDGPNALAAVAPLEEIALGRIEVQSPQPWGYEAEIVRWFGVAPRSRLKPATPAPAGTTGDGTQGGERRSLPGNAPDLPSEPSTPAVPDARS